MNRAVLVLAAAAGLAFWTTAIYAQAPRGDSATPGHRMQDQGSVPGHPGASGFAPGHDRDDLKRDRDDRTTGVGDRDRDDMRRGDRDDLRKKDRDDR